MSQNLESSSNREREIFLAALDQATLAERAAFVKSACRGDDSLRTAVEALLANANDPLLDEVAEAARPAFSEAWNEKPGDRIGRYKLLEKIGEGGFGVVYLAEQREPVKRRVAVKIIKLGMDTKQVIARFEAERQALALMDHPNIAKVLDGGATGNGRPYFVMELVRGVPLTQYCDENQLTIGERLQLFLQVCQAVQHAHQKGIIHRDLKPSNILVTVNDGAPVPQIIDFGIAKATQQELTDKTIFTQFYHFIGTPAYVSPEQAQMTSADIDTRSDIYALGVLLYELLTGQTPFDAKELLASGLDEMRRTIREKEPLRPSTRLKQTSAIDRAPSVVGSAHRQPKPAIDPDLDWIVMKCLEKDRNRRYETANGLAADVRRHLNSEPVLARPPNAIDQLHKFVRRHRTASVGSVLVALAVALGGLVSTWALVKQRAANERANQRLRAALAFVDEVFIQVAPNIAGLAGAAKANETLGQSGLRFVEQLRESAADDPELRLALARVLLRVSQNQNPGGGNTVGEYAAGLQRAQEAVQLLNARTQQLPESERLNLLCDAKFAVIQCLYGLGRWDDGIAQSNELGLLLQRLAQLPEFNRRGQQQLMAVRSNGGYAMILAGRPQEAIELLQDLLKTKWARELSDQSKSDELEGLANIHDSLAAAFVALNEFESVLAPADKSLRLWHMIVGRSPLNAAFAATSNLPLARQGHARLVTGRADDGLASLRQAREEAEKLVQKDGENISFLQVRATVTAIQAWAFANWSEEQTCALSERRQRLLQADSHLAETESFCRQAKSKESDFYLEAARAAAALAKAKLEAAEQVEGRP